MRKAICTFCLWTFLLCLSAQSEYRRFIRDFVNNPQSTKSPMKSEQGNEKPILLSSDLPARVDPLLSDNWDQEKDPYLRFTPLDNMGNHCVVGCVALAMGEVMRYWQWPKDAYDWKNMLDDYKEGQFTEAQGDAVGHLLADCGRKVSMFYGTTSSAAKSIRQPAALVDSLGYDIGAQVYFRDFFRQSEWHNLLHKELAAGRPILLSAMSATLSHAFVCDGYNEEGLYHINWGNPNHEEDGWYNFDIMTPDQPKWYVKDNPERGLNLIQHVCVGVQPPVQDSKETHFFGLSYINTLEGFGKKDSRVIHVITHNLGNVGWNIHHGRVGLALKYKGEVVDILADYSHKFELEEILDTTYTDTLLVDVQSPIKTLGEYHIVPVFEDNGEWVEARTSVGVPNYVSLELTSDGLIINEIQSAHNHLTITSFDFPDTLVQNVPPRYSISIKNESDTQYCGRIYFSLVNPNLPKKNNVFSMQGMYIDPGETITRTFFQTPLRNIPAGKYTLNIIADMDLFTDSVVTLGNYEKRVVSVVSTGVDEAEANKGKDIDFTDISKSYYDINGRKATSISPNHIYISRDRKSKYTFSK